jgi:peptidoglycan/xylan/chitin deacetylase (PgdA/CDA1 family)
MKKKKQRIAQLNLFLLLVAILSSIILYQKVVSYVSKSKSLARQSTNIINKVKKQTTAYAFSELRLPILMYHYVENVADTSDTIRVSLHIPPDIFEKQIKTLQDADYSFITMNDVANAIENGQEIPRKSIVLTFDDGYRDFYTDVFPILKKYSVKAVAYISPGLLDKPNYMYTNQVVKIQESGLVEIAAHTVNHIYLKDAQMPVVYYEIFDSKKQLESLIHAPVISFAYPYGAFDAQSQQLVKDAGFRTAVSTIPGVQITESNIFTINRIRPGKRVGEELLTYLQQSSFAPY